VLGRRSPFGRTGAIFSRLRKYKNNQSQKKDLGSSTKGEPGPPFYLLLRSGPDLRLHSSFGLTVKPTLNPYSENRRVRHSVLNVNLQSLKLGQWIVPTRSTLTSTVGLAFRMKLLGSFSFHSMYGMVKVDEAFHCVVAS
jgi:hypothetical protein